ncbi:MAG: hypothetical protein GY703_20695 [Gammaproteobacteria bacterium]|nr:hypothetical protein [Gammaproteobacteria bacterium]
MVKAKTLVLVLFVAVAAGYGLTKAYIYYKVKSELDNMVRIAAPFMEISYGDIGSDLKGALSVRKLDFLFLSGGETMQIESVELRGSGPEFLYQLAAGFGGLNQPDNVTVNLLGVSVPADQNFSSGLGFSGMDDTESGIPYQTEPCTLGGILNNRGMEALGTSTLVADVTFSYSLDRKKDNVQVFLDSQVDDISSFSIEMNLNNLPRPGAVMMGSLPKLGKFELQYRVEPKYATRMLAHCAEQAGKSPEDFVESLFDLSEQQFASNLGAVPGPGIQETLRTLVAEGGDIQLTADPNIPFDPIELATYQPEEMLQKLGLEMSLNDKPVKDLSISLPSDGASPSWISGLRSLSKNSEPLSAQTGTQSSGQKGTTGSGTRTVNDLRFVDTRVSELHRHIGKQVKLYSRSAKRPKQGQLESITGDIISVKQRVHRGSLTAHIQLSEVNRAEVQLKVPKQK